MPGVSKQSKYMKGPAVDYYGQAGAVDGSRVLIGDRLYLTAGHMAFEYNHKHDSSPASIVKSDIISRTTSSDSYNIALDYRNYQQRYADQVRADYQAHPANHPLNSTIEGRSTLSSNDAVIITGSGSATASNYGMVLFLSSSDMVGTSLASALPQGSAFFDGYNSGVVEGGLITSATAGRLAYSISDQEGDSGGAYLLNWQGNIFIIGSISGKDQAQTQSFGTYFTTSDWTMINNYLIKTQSGNVTAVEPTNLIVGTAADDTTMYGSYRADIVVGLGGNDTLDGGDRVVTGIKAWANDQLFGGAGHDTFIGGYGNDLIYGADRPGSSATSDSAIAQDVSDTADYSSFSDGSSGLVITVGGAPIDSTFASNPDFNRAVFVKDIGHDLAVDTLIFVEKIIGTSSSDTLKIFNTDLPAIADASSHTGGLYSVDLMGAGQTGNVVDLTEAVSGAHFDMATGRLAVGVGKTVEVLNATKVTGSPGPDVISGTQEGNVIDGAGGDDVLFAISPAGGTLPVDQLVGGEGKDTLVASTSCQLTGGTGNDTFWVQRNDGAPSKIEVMDPEAGDTLVWNGYSLAGGEAIHLDARQYVVNGSPTFQCQMGYMDSHGVIYYYNTQDPSNLSIFTPDSQHLYIRNWSPGLLGISLSGPLFDRGQYTDTSDPFPGVRNSDVCFDDVFVNTTDIALRHVTDGTVGPIQAPLMPFV